MVFVKQCCAVYAHASFQLGYSTRVKPHVWGDIVDLRANEIANQSDYNAKKLQPSPDFRKVWESYASESILIVAHGANMLQANSAEKTDFRSTASAAK